MNNLHNNWHKFLFEAQEKEIATSSTAIHKLKVNEYFRNKFMRDLLRIAVIPALKRQYSKEELRKILEIIKFSKTDIETKSAYEYINSNEFNILDYKPSSVGDYFFGSKKDSQTNYFDEFNDRLGIHIFNDRIKKLVVYSLYYMLYKELPEYFFEFPKSTFKDIYSGLYSPAYKDISGTGKAEPPTSPILKRIGKISVAPDIAELNTRILEKESFYLREEDVKSVTFLDKFKIGKFLGEGAFGKVFELERTNFVIKIFKDSVDLQKDMERYQKVEDQLFGGTASVEDMHYFESGVIGKDRRSSIDIYYAVMPKIVPLTKGHEYQKHEAAYKEIFKALRDAARYDRFSEDELLLYLEKNVPISLQAFPRDYILKIVKAYVRARDVFGGRDLHGGNIGYFPFSKDTQFFFYYDM